MINRTFLFLILVSSLFAFACTNNQSNANTAANLNSPKILPPFTKDAKPAADPEIAVIETEGYGTIKMELYSSVAPATVAQFKALANEGFFNGTTFHRINQSVIQGGDPNSKDDNPTNDGAGSSNKPNLLHEFSDIPFEAGIVGAARRGNPPGTPDGEKYWNSGNSQFFITLKREPGFDKLYTVFGKVIEGMNEARIISGAPTTPGTERPAEKIVIKSISIQKR